MLAQPQSWKISPETLKDPRWTLVERILGSDEFHKAPQLRSILSYIAARSIEAPTVNISEQEIGVVVLQRGPDFHPASDNIVRAQVRHLRMKLYSYYSGEGRDESTVITIPKGHYVAHFEARGASGLEIPAGETAVRRWRPLSRLGLALAILAVIVAMPVLRSAFRSSATRMPPAYEIYEDVLEPAVDHMNHETLLVLSNPHAMLYGAPDDDAGSVRSGLLERVRQAGFNPGLTFAAGSFHLGRLMHILGRKTRVTEARFLNWNSVRGRDLIVLGFPGPGEWVSENAPAHAYRVARDGIRNLDPAPGEPELFPLVLDDKGMAVTDHGLLWSWLSPEGNRILLLAGASPAATGAMAVLFSEPAEFTPLYERLKLDAAEGPLPTDWQALLRIDFRDNSPLRAEYVAHRIYPRPR